MVCYMYHKIPLTFVVEPLQGRLACRAPWKPRLVLYLVEEPGSFFFKLRVGGPGQSLRKEQDIAHKETALDASFLCWPSPKQPRDKASEGNVHFVRRGCQEHENRSQRRDTKKTSGPFGRKRADEHSGAQNDRAARSPTPQRILD